MTRISIVAKALPMQTRGPTPKGIHAGGIAIRPVATSSSPVSGDRSSSIKASIRRNSEA